MSLDLVQEWIFGYENLLSLPVYQNTREKTQNANYAKVSKTAILV